MASSRQSESEAVTSVGEPSDTTNVRHIQSIGFEGGLPPEPELKLMAMILEDAISCYLRYGNAKSATGRREGQSAERWLFSRDRQWIFSFENICTHLGADPEFVRRQIRDRRLKGSLGRRRQGADNGEHSSRAAD